MMVGPVSIWILPKELKLDILYHPKENRKYLFLIFIFYMGKRLKKRKIFNFSGVKNLMY